VGRGRREREDVLEKDGLDGEKSTDVALLGSLEGVEGVGVTLNRED
jgi:hypothetical protein